MAFGHITCWDCKSGYCCFRKHETQKIRYNIHNPIIWDNCNINKNDRNPSHYRIINYTSSTCPKFINKPNSNAIHCKYGWCDFNCYWIIYITWVKYIFWTIDFGCSFFTVHYIITTNNKENICWEN